MISQFKPKPKELNFYRIEMATESKHVFSFAQRTAEDLSILKNMSMNAHGTGH